jgi:aspartate carbamoyltransferase catalytic subunit
VNHFLEISQLTCSEAMSLIERALWLKQAKTYPQYPHYVLANLFYEASTRTRTSFELAAKKLMLSVLNLDLQFSSEKKGEVIQDTVKTLASMGTQVMVIRHVQEGLPQQLALTVPKGVHVINAGDGMGSHPTQAMLDLMTILERKPNLNDLKIVIVGDVLHSRVANSLQGLCKLLNVGALDFVAPRAWLPTTMDYGTATTSLQEGLRHADVVIALRVQKERLSSSDLPDLDAYVQEYAITPKTMALAKRDAIVMHPGPLNRGIEMDSVVADGPQSCIWEQVKNGVFMRMAIIESLLMHAR